MKLDGLGMPPDEAAAFELLQAAAVEPDAAAVLASSNFKQLRMNACPRMSYLDTDGGAPQAPGIDLEEVGSVDFELPQAANVLYQVSFDPPLCLAADGVYVIELFLPASPDGFASIAGNVGPDDQTYIRTDDCGLANYVSYESIGFPTQLCAQPILGEAGCDGITTAQKLSEGTQNFDIPSDPIRSSNRTPPHTLDGEVKNYVTKWNFFI